MFPTYLLTWALCLVQACWMPWGWVRWWLWATLPARLCAWSWPSGSRAAWQASPGPTGIRPCLSAPEPSTAHDSAAHPVCATPAGPAAAAGQACPPACLRLALPPACAALGFVSPALPTSPDNGWLRATLGAQLRFVLVRAVLADDRLGLR